jgi:hypothetical protein
MAGDVHEHQLCGKEVSWMKKMLSILALSMGLSMAAHAEDWTGKLIDATCNDQRDKEKTVSCDATSQTTAFALDVSGKIFKLDAGGNTKAAVALKYRANSPSDPAKPKPAGLQANVTGTEAGGMILVESIGLQ